MTILARNVREKMAEIDIIAQDRDTLVFVEVRTRKDTRLGHPAETIGASKQRSVRRAAEAFMAKRGLTQSQTAVRFDAISIVWDTGEVEHIENAF
jgi:putative endonuclease